MLYTEVPEITSDSELQATLSDNENVMLCVGRNGPMCLPVYDLMESMGPAYEHVTFRVMPFDLPVANAIRSMPEVRTFMGLPFTLYFKNGKVVEATSSIQNRDQVSAILEQRFAA